MLEVSLVMPSGVRSGVGARIGMSWEAACGEFAFSAMLESAIVTN